MWRAPKHDIDSREDGSKTGARDLSDAALQNEPIKGNDLGDVGNGRLGEAGLA
jgi:hypothetical protein